MDFSWISEHAFVTHPIVLVAALILLWIYKKTVRRAGPGWPRIPTTLISWALILYLLAPLVARLGNDSFDTFIDVAALLALLLGMARAAIYFFIDYVLEQRRRVRIPTITSDLLLAIVWFLTIMVVLRNKLNFDLASLITTSAILTAVIGFALQDTLGNLFAGLAIQAERPYQIGDWVQLAQYTGQVEGISWKSTKIVTTTRETVYVPNSSISKGAIFNYSQPTPEYVATMDIGVTYDVPPNRVRRVLLDVLLRHPKIMLQRKQEVRIKAFGDSAIIYQLRFWVNNYALADKIKGDLSTHIWYRFRREKFHVPYPMREIIQAEPPIAVTSACAVEEALESIDLFQPLGDVARKKLAQSVRTSLYGSHEEIVQQGAPAHSLYVIISGHCRVFVATEKGAAPKPIALLGPGDFFGEMSLLTGAPRSATVVAEEETECVVINKNDVKGLLLAKPEIAQELSRLLAERQAALSEATASHTPAEIASRSQQILAKIWDFLKT